MSNSPYAVEVCYRRGRASSEACPHICLATCVLRQYGRTFAGFHSLLTVMARTSLVLALTGIAIALLLFVIPHSTLESSFRSLPPMPSDPPVYWNLRHLLTALAGLCELSALVMGSFRWGTKLGKISVAIAAPAFFFWFLLGVVAEQIFSHRDQ